MSRAPALQLDAILISTKQDDTLLNDFPDIIAPNLVQSPTKHGIQHFIITKGQPA